MGHTTDFIGHVDIEPALNQDEIEYLTAFGLTRHFDRPDGPYAVSGNPMAAQDQERASVDTETYSSLGPGKPQLYCQWVPCLDGCCLSFDGNEKFYQPVAWMRYLIQHFLKPGALASKSGLPAFEHFTFDHRARRHDRGLPSRQQGAVRHQREGQPGDGASAATGAA